MGHATRTLLNLEVVQVDTERNLLLVKGAIPGPKDQDVVIRPSVKAKGTKKVKSKK
jgi:large subunit ribosomal protein L3